MKKTILLLYYQKDMLKKISLMIFLSVLAIGFSAITAFAAAPVLNSISCLGKKTESLVYDSAVFSSEKLIYSL